VVVSSVVLIVGGRVVQGEVVVVVVASVVVQILEVEGIVVGKVVGIMAGVVRLRTIKVLAKFLALRKFPLIFGHFIVIL